VSRGRGLLLVDLLTDVWGVEARGGGKCVWCEFVMPEEKETGAVRAEWS
jgi:hypothetical protein